MSATDSTLRRRADDFARQHIGEHAVDSDETNPLPRDVCARCSMTDSLTRLLEEVVRECALEAGEHEGVLAHFGLSERPAPERESKEE